MPANTTSADPMKTSTKLRADQAMRGRTSLGPGGGRREGAQRGFQIALGVDQEVRRYDDPVTHLEAVADLDVTPPRAPTSTLRGSNRPSPRSTKTSRLSPVSIIALSARLERPRPTLANSASAYIAGRSKPSGFGSSTRTRTVRDCCSIWG